MEQFDQKSEQRRTQELGAWLYVDELMHRTLNDYTAMLSLVRLASQSASVKDKVTALDEVAARLRASAATFNALKPFRNVSLRSLDLTLADLCDAISRSLPEDRRLTLRFNGKPITINAHRCWQISLIVAELVTNAVRHAFRCRNSGLIVVDARILDGCIQCSVTDDGISEMVVSPGRGTAIVDALALELGGMVIRRFSGSGSTVTLRVPIFEVPPG